MASAELKTASLIFEKSGNKERIAEMKNTNEFASSQLYTKKLKNGRIIIFSSINNFKCGELDYQTSTFHSVPRSTKNLFRIYNGLGLNAYLLQHFDFIFIEIPFNGNTLRTTKEKWLREGKASKYSNDKVDPQIILPLSKINMEELIQFNEDINQFSLFGEVA
jgi:hypothetical protein